MYLFPEKCADLLSLTLWSGHTDIQEVYLRRTCLLSVKRHQRLAYGMKLDIDCLAIDAIMCSGRFFTKEDNLIVPSEA